MKFLLVLSLFLCVTAAVPVVEPVKDVPPAPAVPVEGAPAAPEVAAEEVVEELEMKKTNDQDEEPMAKEEEEEEEVLNEGDMVVDEGTKMEEEEEVLGNEVEPDLRHEPVVVEDPEEMADNTVDETPQSRFRYCPDGWFKHNARCFLLVNTPMSWYNAEEHCNNLGASLASVQNPGEYRFLQQLTQIASQTTAWLGGFYLQGRWMWIDRQGFYYTNWYSQSSVTSYPCVFLRSNNGWGNSNCGTSQRFICSSNPSSC